MEGLASNKFMDESGKMAREGHCEFAIRTAGSTLFGCGKVHT